MKNTSEFYLSMDLPIFENHQIRRKYSKSPEESSSLTLQTGKCGKELYDLIVAAMVKKGTIEESKKKCIVWWKSLSNWADSLLAIVSF